MRNGDPGPSGQPASALDAEVADRDRPGPGQEPDAGCPLIITEISPFHCLYQDALDFHSQSRLMLPRSESASSRLARAALLLYVASAEALIHQAAEELGRPELAQLISDPARPLPLADAWRLLPAIVGQGPAGSGDPTAPPWPQFAELLALRSSWAYPGTAPNRRAYYRAIRPGADFEPLQPHQIPKGIGVTAETLLFPRTGLPRDPYALRPHHLDTARGVLDSAIESLNRRLDGLLTRDNRHRREPIRVVPTPSQPHR
jgi:hypothetical protein